MAMTGIMKKSVMSVKTTHMMFFWEDRRAPDQPRLPHTSSKLAGAGCTFHVPVSLACSEVDPTHWAKRVLQAGGGEGVGEVGRRAGTRQKTTIETTKASTMQGCGVPE